MFDGDRDIGDGGADKVLLCGAPRQSEVGFLTLFEAYGHVEVGTRLKRPAAPVWVVCSESHYSVLFSLEACRCAAVGEGAATGGSTRTPFDVHYYDGLANQDEPIVLTVDPTPATQQPGADDDGDLIPPLDLVVRTKWRGAAVDWNGTDPIL